MKETIREYFDLQTKLRTLLKHENNTYVTLFGLNAVFGNLEITNASLFDDTLIVKFRNQKTTMSVNNLDDELMTELNNQLKIILYNLNLFININ